MIFLFLFSTLAIASPVDWDGRWIQDCSHGFRKEELFRGDFAEYTEHNFRDADCSVSSSDSISRGRLIPGGVVSEPAGASELDFIFESVSFVARDQRAADTFNRIALCGLSGWAVNEEKNISGLICEFFGPGIKFRVPSAGTRKFGVAKIEGENLFLGKLSSERNGNSPETRPLVLDTVPYRRVR